MKYFFPHFHKSKQLIQPQNPMHANNIFSFPVLANVGWENQANKPALHLDPAYSKL